MVTFSHLDTGTTEAEWMASPRWSQLRWLALADVTRLVVLAAHPDDETLGAAGLIARASALGANVTVIVATDGEGSHPNSPTHSSAELAAVRRTELRDAARLVAPGAEIEFLGIPDGHLPEHSETVRRRLEDAVGAHGVDGLLLLAPWQEDGHRDHRVAGAVARAVAQRTGARLLEYPIWMWHWADPENAAVPWDAMLRLELTPAEQSAKARALDAHRSQTRPLSDAPGDEALLNPEVQRHFDRGWEVFIGPDSPAASLPEPFFDRFYAGKSDPWGFETRWYEERKRAIVLACLPRKRFASGLEVGCSTGVLTAELAVRCEQLLGIDIAAAPLEIARDRLRDATGVGFARMTTPRQWPDGDFDLIVLSEVGYYWGEADLEVALDNVLSSLSSDGVLLACHWRHRVPEYPLDGDDVHAAIGRRTALVPLVRHVEEDFVLEVFSRPPAPSVARETGLIG